MARDATLSLPKVVVTVVQVAGVDDVGDSPLSRGSAGAGAGVVLALAESHPALIFVVQTQINVTATATSHNNLHLCQRVHGTPHTVADAALYLMRVPAAIPGPIRPHIEAELRAHLPVLQAQRSAILILTCPLLPEPGAVSRQTELLARLRDLACLQLTGSGLLTLQELVELVGSIHDAHGGLVILRQIDTPNSAVVGLVVRYQPLLPLTG